MDMSSLFTTLAVVDMLSDDAEDGSQSKLKEFFPVLALCGCMGSSQQLTPTTTPAVPGTGSQAPMYVTDNSNQFLMIVALSHIMRRRYPTSRYPTKGTSTT
jgi:hypothetical protein